ncbi:hypothetical protein EDB85DRAFT_378931 [Lactarius pseudohatsudake]|nr:hypothetical protein EDB85DRAFT_378931 [Lactarius pseudohatsudake]
MTQFVQCLLLTQAQAQAAQATFRPRRKTTKKVTMFELIPTWLSYHIGLIPISPSQATSPSLAHRFLSRFPLAFPIPSHPIPSHPIPSHPILPPNTISLFLHSLSRPVTSLHYIKPASA